MHNTKYCNDKAKLHNHRFAYLIEEDDGIAYYTPPKTRYNLMQDIS
jgi:hypothetical protein